METTDLRAQPQILLGLGALFCPKGCNRLQYTISCRCLLS